MVYDLNDRLVAYRDARMAAANQWQYTKYDALNRVVMTGVLG
jgi:YD repeat-containing protein